MKAWTKTAWTGALLLSLLVHGGAAVLLAGREDIVEIAGGNPVDIAVLGNSFEDAVSAGEMTETLEPETAEAHQPSEAETAMAERVHSPIADSASAAETPDAVEAETSPIADPTVAEAEGSVAVPSAETPERQEPVSAAEPEASAVVQAQTAPRADTASAEDSDVETAEAVDPAETVNPVADAPIPMPRPDIEALKAEEERREAERRRQAQRQQAVRQQDTPRQQQTRPAAGAGGSNQADARRGDAAGSTQGRAAQSSGQGSQASAAGNAAVSNYPGQVVSRLRRSLSYPAQARRQRITGEVHVAFTIAANGGVSGIRIVRSSGHAILDEAALQAVHRAAPFPAIPSAAGRSSWGFTVPLAFSR